MNTINYCSFHIIVKGPSEAGPVTTWQAKGDLRSSKTYLYYANIRDTFYCN